MKGPELITFVCLLLISFHGSRAQPPPKYVMSELAYRETLRSMETHVKYVTSLPGFRNGSTPLFYLHRPGSRVYGTVLIFHGYGLNAGWNAIQARILHANKFNVISFNLAGFAQDSKFWISTVLRKSAGYDRIRKVLQNDPDIAQITANLRQGTNEQQTAYHNSLKDSVMPKIFASLKKGLARNDYIVAERAFKILQPGAIVPDMEKKIRKYFISEHQTYESDPFHKLRLVNALPGPVHAVGFSLGGSAVVNLAAQSKVISKAVLLAPFFGRRTQRKSEDFTYLRSVLGALDLTSIRFPLRGNVVVEAGGRQITPSFVASTLLNRDFVLNSMRESTETLCIIAEVDSSVDVTHTLEVCRSKLAGKTFVYPSSLKLDHFITPETGSKYGTVMVEQIAAFFKTGRVTTSEFLHQGA